MKLALLAFLFLLLNSSTAQVVLDTDGEPLQSSDDYYMVRPISLGPSGVFLASTGNNKTCPVDVIAEHCCYHCIPYENCNGEALKFRPLAEIGVVKTNHQLSIRFAETPSCAQSPEWILVKEEGAWLVGIGGPEDHPGKQTLTGWFIIERIDAVPNVYRLKFCPKFLPQICGYLGSYGVGNGKWRLALTRGFPHTVIFLKANKGSSGL